MIERVTIMSGLLTGMSFLRHTVDIAPIEGAVGFVEGDGWRSAGIFKGGEWKRTSGAPFARKATHWSILDQQNRGGGADSRSVRTVF